MDRWPLRQFLITPEPIEADAQELGKKQEELIEATLLMIKTLWYVINELNLLEVDH